MSLLPAALFMSAITTVYCLARFYSDVVVPTDDPDDVPEWPACGTAIGAVITLILAAVALVVSL